MKKPKISMLISKSKKRGYTPSVMIDVSSSPEAVKITDKQFKRIRKNETGKDIYARVGGNIRVLRIKNKLSVKELAVKSGIKAPFLSNIENGKRKATLYSIEKIAGGLDVDIRDLIGLEVKNDGLTDKEFFRTVLLKQGKLIYTKIKTISEV